MKSARAALARFWIGGLVLLFPYVIPTPDVLEAINKVMRGAFR